MLTDQRAINALNLEQLQAVYSISRVVLQTADTRTALQEIIRLSRPVFIFDNIVIYHLRETNHLEPTYARSVGRGRSAEADMAWGETVAQEVVQTERTIIRSEEIKGETSNHLRGRLRQRYYLGLPLKIGDDLLGALVFIRFGGPPYLPEQINLAGFITEHVAQLLAFQQLHERIARLETEQRLTRLQEDFVAAVSHDLRSPLGFIKGYATSLLREDANWDAETRREFLTIIDEESDRLTALIDNLLDSSRLQAGTLKMNFQPIRLDALLTDAVRRAQSREYNLNLYLDFKTSPNRISGDPLRLTQVFDNLLANAHKYAPGADVHITLDWDSDTAHIRFRDTGPGIPQEHLEDIFNRFYRLPRQNQTSQNGTGLGLYICREIVRNHHGQIYAESGTGQGTTIHILLPKKHPASETQEGQP